MVLSFKKTTGLLFADGVRIFREFLRGEFSDENIEFWIACRDYKGLEDDQDLPTRAQAIFDEFVAFQSQREVRLDFGEWKCLDAT